MSSPLVRGALVGASTFVALFVFIGFVQSREADRTIALRRDGVDLPMTIAQQNERRTVSHESDGTRREEFNCDARLEAQLDPHGLVRVSLHEPGRCARHVGATINVMVSRRDPSVWMLRERFVGRDAGGHESNELAKRAAMAGIAAVFVGGLVGLIARKPKARGEGAPSGQP